MRRKVNVSVTVSKDILNVAGRQEGGGGDKSSASCAQVGVSHVKQCSWETQKPLVGRIIVPGVGVIYVRAPRFGHRANAKKYHPFELTQT